MSQSTTRDCYAFEADTQISDPGAGVGTGLRAEYEEKRDSVSVLIVACILNDQELRDTLVEIVSIQLNNVMVRRNQFGDYTGEGDILKLLTNPNEVGIMISETRKRLLEVLRCNDFDSFEELWVERMEKVLGCELNI